MNRVLNVDNRIPPSAFGKKKHLTQTDRNDVDVVNASSTNKLNSSEHEDIPKDNVNKKKKKTDRTDDHDSIKKSELNSRVESTHITSLNNNEQPLPSRKKVRLEK